MNGPEKKLYNRLKKHKSKPPGPWWKITSIESSTSPGIPDCSVVTYEYHGKEKEFKKTEFWLELKAQPLDHPWLRPHQFKWLLERACIGSNCFLLNYHTKKKEYHLWRFHDNIPAEALSIDRISLVGLPTYQFKSVSELIAFPPERFNLPKT